LTFLDLDFKLLLALFEPLLALLELGPHLLLPLLYRCDTADHTVSEVCLLIAAG
jgi:hypothetical protein